MKGKILTGILMLCLTLTTVALPAVSADTLAPSDFTAESFSKTVDYFEYAREWAADHGLALFAPPPTWHANLFMTYINTSGLQLLYAGLSNVTFDEQTYLTIPMQSFLLHYKSENRSRDVLLASTFLMLLAFNETMASIYPNSPDVNDNLWASFSLGFDFSAFNLTAPALNSKTTIYPLTSSADKLQWSWGMKYTNLTAVWWNIDISPTNPSFNSSAPMAITTYDELTFNYTLTINPDTHRATLTENHAIGRVRDLWHLWGWIWVPRPTVLYTHYNSTGGYFYGEKVTNDTVYQFLDKNQIKMSIVAFQTSVMLDHDTYSVSASGQNVTDSDDDVSGSQITTYADDGERIFDVAFGVKETYKLYNYTADQSETTFNTYNSTTRTARIGGFANNAGLFVFHIGLMRLLPLVLWSMSIRQDLYNEAKDTITDMSRARYFYLIAYPTYSGFRVEHDPVTTIYLTTTVANPPNWIGLILIGAFIIAVAVGAVALVRRRKPKTQPTEPTQPTTST